MVFSIPVSGYVHLVLIVLMMGVAGCGDASNGDVKQAEPSDRSEVLGQQTYGIIEIEDDQFDDVVLASDKLVLLDFWAEWCLPCLELEPLMPEVSKQFGDRLLIAKINIYDQPDLVAEYVTDTIYPCLILMKDAQILDRRYGTDPDMEPKEFLLIWVEGFLNENRE